MANALVSGSGSGIPLIQDIEPSNSRDRLSHATLRFLSLAGEECTKNWHEHRHCTSEYDLFGMIVNIAVGASHNEASTVG